MKLEPRALTTTVPPLPSSKVYFFTRGSVKPANKKYASTRNDYELSLDGR